MNWLRKTAFIILAIGLSWPSWVSAQGQEQTEQPAQGAQTEIKMGCERRWNALDKDGDGQVSLEELTSSRAARGRRAEGFFQRRDLDGNGVLTKEEFCASKEAVRAAGRGPNRTRPRPPATTEPLDKGTTP